MINRYVKLNKILLFIYLFCSIEVRLTCIFLSNKYSLRPLLIYFVLVLMDSIERNTLGYQSNGKILNSEQLKYYNDKGFILIKKCVPLNELERYK